MYFYLIHNDLLICSASVSDSKASNSIYIYIYIFVCNDYRGCSINPRKCLDGLGQVGERIQSQ
jgi:hypothetical protein